PAADAAAASCESTPENQTRAATWPQPESLLGSRGELQVAIKDFLPANHVKLERLIAVDQVTLIEDVIDVLPADSFPDMQTNENAAFFYPELCRDAPGANIEHPHPAVVAIAERVQLRLAGFLESQS